MRRLIRTTIPLAGCLVAGLVAAGQPKTPLGRWMQPNVGVPKSALDYETLQKSLGIVAAKPPPIAKYPKWVAIAKAGADAAGKQNLDALRKSCDDCHNLYKAKYIEDQANRPFP